MALQFYYKTVHEDPLLDKGWKAITNFYYYQKNYQKALYYINKAIDIDAHNMEYWERYCAINAQLQFYEEAERGYRKLIELGNHDLEIWLNRSDLLLKLGENDAAVQNLLQALEFYPDNAEVEFRLAGLYYSLNEIKTGQYHLVNALQNENEYVIILEELFGHIYQRKSVQDIINKHISSR